MQWLQPILRLFGDENAAAFAKAKVIVGKVNALEEGMKALTDAALEAKTIEFKERISKGETLDALAAEAFAVVREASRRTLNQRHFDVQLIGGMILHNGDIAEMRTGEGKTLVATLPCYLNALTGKGVHVVTVNDYLSRRDAAWMGQIYEALGMTTGVINHDSSFIYDSAHVPPEMLRDEDRERDETGAFKVQNDFLRPCSRKEAYHADITYGTNNEFGFDYLRDNLEYEVDKMRQRLPKEGGYNFAIVDEIDSILIDEARTPLIISAPIAEAESLYTKFSNIARDLKKEDDYTVDEKRKQIVLTDSGIEKAEKILGIDNIYTDAGIKMVHHLETAVRAQALYTLNKEYVVKNGEIVIVDEFTGRMQPGRRWSDGLHQAIEAKEGVLVQNESRTFASITFQNYFRLYGKLAGMTGTAVTSSEEFYKVYGLNTVQVPTNRTNSRADRDDLIYKGESGKLSAIAKHVKEKQLKGQPVLIGTVSVEKNEELSRHFKAAGIPHEVLNAKNHEREGEIIAQAGRKGAVTIATNMAGRGVDIKLGGSPAPEGAAEEVKALGGLAVIGTERHEARRIDNQLRGRAGRQGDPGETQFYVSLDDSLMRIFASDTVKWVMNQAGMSDDEAIHNSLITRSLEKAQTKIEEFHFDSRKHVLSYDDVLNIQRMAVYSRRRSLLISTNDEVDEELKRIEALHPGFMERMEKRKEDLGDLYYPTIRRFLLQAIDYLWVDHLEAMEYLRSSVNLRAYGQRDPLVEYKKEGLKLYNAMDGNYADYVAHTMPNVGRQSQLVQAQEKVAEAAVQITSESPSDANVKSDYDRNERVKITNGTETQEMKYKKAEEFLKKGWRIVE